MSANQGEPAWFHVLYIRWRTNHFPRFVHNRTFLYSFLNELTGLTEAARMDS